MANYRLLTRNANAKTIVRTDNLIKFEGPRVFILGRHLLSIILSFQRINLQVKSVLNLYIKKTMCVCVCVCV